MNLIVARGDMNLILTYGGWTSDIQEARLFSNKSAATNAAHTALGTTKSRRRRTGIEPPDLKHSEVVLVSAEDYAAMQADLDKLNALEAAGVDNWQGYDDAMAIMRGEDPFE